MLSTWQGRAAIDPQRVGMFGFSAGGFTALAIIGGVPDFTHGRLEKDMIAVRLTPDTKMIAVASPDYLSRSGTPHSPADLHAHACISWRLQADGRVYRWEFEKKGKRLEVATEGPLVTNQPDVGDAAALQGLGILYAFDHDRNDAALALGQLVQVLADWSITKPGLFLYYSNRRHSPAALGAFIDCLLDRDVPAAKRKSKASV